MRTQIGEVLIWGDIDVLQGIFQPSVGVFTSCFLQMAKKE